MNDREPEPRRGENPPVTLNTKEERDRLAGRSPQPRSTERVAVPPAAPVSDNTVAEVVGKEHRGENLPAGRKINQGDAIMFRESRTTSPVAANVTSLPKDTSIVDLEVRQTGGRTKAWTNVRYAQDFTDGPSWHFKN